MSTHRFDMSKTPHDPLAPVWKRDKEIVSVTRAIGDLRRGLPVVVTSEESALLIYPAEMGGGISAISNVTGEAARCIVTATRANTLGFDTAGLHSVEIHSEAPLEPENIQAIIDDTSRENMPADLSVAPTFPLAGTALGLIKLARLLPAALCSAVKGDASAFAADNNFLTVAAAAIAHYQQKGPEELEPVVEVDVPLFDAEDAKMITFRPADGGKPHMAIIVGTPDPAQPVLTRLHSECFTGDLLGSLRCDCGDQLRGAIAAISESGGGVLLYLAQEGRGIGIVNKLRAYRLQDEGFDTIDANERLGFDADERVYVPAASMLRRLGFMSVRLLTNNPNKVEALAQHGINVVDRVPHAFPANGHNEQYLQTKAVRGGHLF